MCLELERASLSDTLTFVSLGFLICRYYAFSLLARRRQVTVTLFGCRQSAVTLFGWVILKF